MKCLKCENDYYGIDEDSGLCRSCLIVAEREIKIKELRPAMIDLCDKLRRIDTEIEKTAFLDALMREHRTNQQLIFGVMLAAINKWAECAANGPGHYDARNEATVHACDIIYRALPGRFQHLPYI